MKNLFFISFIFFTTIASAQYNITVKIKNLPPQKVQFAYYFEDKQYVVAEAESDAKGVVKFKGDDNLPRGIYIVAFAKTPAYFDLLISEEQNFTLKTDTAKLIENMRVEGSKQNALFYEHQREMLKQRMKFEAVDKNIALDSVAKLAEFEILEKETERIQDVFIAKNPQAFMSKLIKAMRAPANETDMWADVDFSESGLIRTPFFVTLVRSHIARNVEKGADYINFENDQLLKKAALNPEMLEYLSFYLLNFYRTFQKAGMNKVFVHLADNYFLNGKKSILDPKLEALIVEQADIFRASIVGAKARNVRVANLAGDSINLYDIAAETTLVYFWSTGCGHCKKSTEHLRNAYLKLQSLNIEVFALNTNETYLNILQKYATENPVPWQTYHDINGNARFKEYFYAVSAPMMYVLDKNKVIRAELHGEEQIAAFLEKLY